MSSPLVFDTNASSLDGTHFVPVLPLPGLGKTGLGDRRDTSTPPEQRSIFALHLVNGEHYSGAERVQDLLARQLPRLGCEVGFVCVNRIGFRTPAKRRPRRSWKCRCEVGSTCAW